MDEQEQWLTTKEIAERTGVARSTVVRWIHNGWIPLNEVRTLPNGKIRILWPGSILKKVRPKRGRPVGRPKKPVVRLKI